MRNYIYDLKLLGVTIQEDVTLEKHNSFKLNVKAKSIIYVNNIDELKKALSVLQVRKEKWFLIGKGSNLLITKNAKGINFVVLRGEFNNFEIKGRKIIAGSAYGIVPASVKAAKSGLSGLEFANGIPGSIGGAIAMNAGAHGSDFSTIVDSVEVMDSDLNVYTLKKEELNLSYRSSSVFSKGLIVTKVILTLKRGDSDEVTEKMNEYKKTRLSSQPLKKRTCGSVFKNPKPFFAAKLIEELGYKDYANKSAKVSSTHANFIEASEGASSEDILKIIEEIKKSVLIRHNIELDLEVKKI